MSKQFPTVIQGENFTETVYEIKPTYIESIVIQVMPHVFTETHVREVQIETRVNGTVYSMRSSMHPQDDVQSWLDVYFLETKAALLRAFVLERGKK
jgi:hypothetical protein